MLENPHKQFVHEHRFTETYGTEITVNGERGKFFYYAQVSRSLERWAEVGEGEPREMVVSDFTTWKDGKEVATLITSIDVTKYRTTLKDLGVREQDILEHLV